MNIYEEIEQENKEILLNTLAKRTLSGKQQWTELKYNPIGFVQQGGDNPFISQGFELQTEYNGRIYEMELFESISIPSKRGDVFITIDFDNEGGRMKYDFALSFEAEGHNDIGTECIGKMYADSNVVKMADVVVGVFKGTEAESFGFSYARYFMEKEIDKKWKKDKMVILGEKLMNEGRMEDFHKAVLDITRV